MSFLDLFKPVSTWTPEEVRRFLHQHSAEEYDLVDVRLPAEYEQAHLPGARLIPIAQLDEKMTELDRNKTIITYCSAGVRSRAAAQTLQHAGFKDVHSMKGGMRAWKGEAAEGLPETDLAGFFAAATGEEQVAMAWRLEEGARRFYAEVARSADDERVVALFRELAADEARHKATLQALFEALSGRRAPAGFPDGIPAAERMRPYMEGGAEVEKALAWVPGRGLKALVAMGVAVEANAYDRYRALRRGLPDENVRRAFEVLSSEEKRHLEKASRLLEELV